MLSKQDQFQKVTHRCSGADYAVVQKVNPEYVRIVAVNQNGQLDNRAFLAWRGQLTATTGPTPNTADETQLLTGECLTAVQLLRADLASGRKVVRFTRIESGRGKN
jgi:hypothetical protein